MPRVCHVVVLVLAAAGIFCPASIAAANDVVVRQFSSGTALDAVGMIDASEDTEIDGPQAIYTGADGEIYLLDQVNGRVLQFDPKHPDQATRSLELPGDLRPTDMVVRGSSIVVWDGSVHALSPTGAADAPVRGLEEQSTRDATEDPFAVSAFAQMGSERLGDDSDLLAGDNTRSIDLGPKPAPPPQLVDSHGRGPVVAKVAVDKNRKRASVEVRRRGRSKPLAKLRIEVDDRLGAVELLNIDRQGRSFVFVENIPTTDEELATAFVARYSPGGALEGVYDLPLSESVALSRRSVAVSPEGDVYFLRTRKTGVDVLGVGFRRLRRTAVIDRPGLRPMARGPLRGRSPIAAVRPLTRQRVIATALAFQNLTWQVNAGAYGPDPDQACTGFRRVRRPGYLAGMLGREVRGVPYCWGCFGTLDTIRTKLARGVLAGNVCTRNEPRRDAIGVDCSAFVSAAWGLASHFTTIAIPAISKPLENPWDLLPGDALNKPGSHVMLFLRFTRDRKIEVMEATPRGCNGRVCRNVYSLASLLAHGYRPVRFRALANEPAPQAKELVQQSSELDQSAQAKHDSDRGKSKKGKTSKKSKSSEKHRRHNRHR